MSEHAAAVSCPARHEDGPDTEYPSLHSGWHDVPLARELVQFPAAPLVGGAEASHGSGLHVPLVSHTPSRTRQGNPVLLRGAAEPLERELAQFPLPPFAGVGISSHGSPAHVAEVKFPPLQ